MDDRVSGCGEAKVGFNSGLSSSKVHRIAAFKYFKSNYDV